MKHLIILSTLILTVISYASELPPKHVKNTTAIKENLTKKDTKKYNRRIYLKLPLLQPRFHWQFSEKDKFLEGNLILIIKSQNKRTEIPIFGKGIISKDWEEMTCSHGNTQNNCYFGFISKITFPVSETDEVFLTLKVNNDISGIGSTMKGLLKAGMYKTFSQFKMFHLEESTGEKDLYAFLNNSDWSILWKLEKTADKGWMEEAYNKKKRIPLTSSKQMNSIEISFNEDEKTVISVVDHKSKEFFFEHFRTYNDLAKYISENIKNMPLTIKHPQYTLKITKEYLLKCKTIQEHILPIKLIYESEIDIMKPLDKDTHTDFYSDYKRREK